MHGAGSGWVGEVSTHSRLKAAGLQLARQLRDAERFNTQPPKGGWSRINSETLLLSCFNTQPPKGGWNSNSIEPSYSSCFNTQPPKGGWQWVHMQGFISTGFNTQPPKGGWGR